MEKEKLLSIRIHRMADTGKKSGDRYYKSLNEGLSHILRTEKMDEDYLLYPELAHLNYHIKTTESIDAKKERVRQLYEDEHRRAMPKNTSPYIDGLITFSDTMREDVKKYGAVIMVEETQKFLMEEFGRENIIAISLHMDESTPHVHFIAMNWDRKAKRTYSQANEASVKANQGKSLLQDRLADHYKANIPDWEYVRGKHQNTKEYHSKRKAQEEHLKSQAKKITLLEAEQDALKAKNDQIKAERDSHAKTIEAMKQEIGELVQSRDDLERQHLEKLWEIVNEFESLLDERNAVSLLRKLLRAAKSQDDERLRKWINKVKLSASGKRNGPSQSQ